MPSPMPKSPTGYSPGSKTLRVPGTSRGLLLEDVARDYVQYMKAERGLSRATTDSYSSWIQHFIKWLRENGYSSPDLSAFNPAVLKRFFYEVSARGYRPRTIRSVFHPLKGLAKYLISVNAIKQDPTSCIVFPKKDAAQRLTVSEQELTALTEACDRYVKPKELARSRALLSVMICCGLRAQELIDLKLEHVSLPGKTLLVANGKGSKSRMLYPPDETLAALQEWLQLREPTCRHEYVWALDTHRRMGYLGLLRWLEELKCMAGLRGRPNIKPHSIRHAFATRMHNNGAPIKAIQAALGHSDAQTTFIYLHLQEEQSKLMSSYAALSGLKPPNEGRRGRSAPGEPSASASKPSAAEMFKMRRTSQRQRP